MDRFHLNGKPLYSDCFLLLFVPSQCAEPDPSSAPSPLSSINWKGAGMPVAATPNGTSTQHSFGGSSPHSSPKGTINSRFHSPSSQPSRSFHRHYHQNNRTSAPPSSVHMVPPPVPTEGLILLLFFLVWYFIWLSQTKCVFFGLLCFLSFSKCLIPFHFNAANFRHKQYHCGQTIGSMVLHPQVQVCISFSTLSDTISFHFLLCCLTTSVDRLPNVPTSFSSYSTNYHPWTFCTIA